MKDLFYRAFGKKVRAYREGAELSQLALADRLGVSRTSITNIEQGKQRLPLHMVVRLATILGTGLNELVPSMDEISEDDTITEVLKSGRLTRGDAAKVESVLRSLSDDDQRRWVRVLRREGSDGEE